jgi:putative transposase
MDSKIAELFKDVFSRNEILKTAREVKAVQRLRGIHPQDFCLALVSCAMGDEERSIATARREFAEIADYTPEESSFYDRFTAPMATAMQRLVRKGFERCNRKHRRALAAALRGSGLADVQAIDATQVALPAGAEAVFPSTDDERGGIKLTAVVSVLFQTVDKVTYTNARTHDRKALRLDRWLHGRLLLMDKGYYDHSLFQLIEDRQGFFLVPLKDNAFPTIKAVRSGLGKIHVGAELTGDLPYRGIVDVDAKFSLRGGKTYSGRVVRVTVEKDCRDGTVELVDIWLATNLPADKFTAEQIATLYRLRWEVEVSFRIMKSVGRLDHLRSTNEHVILAFVYATLLGMILAQQICAWMRSTWEDREPSFHRVAALVFGRIDGVVSALGTVRYRKVIASFVEALRREGVNPNPGRPYAATRYAKEIGG